MSTYSIDDRDPQVTYNGTWMNGGSSEVEYKGTVSSSTHVGDFFTVSFRGTNIAVFVTFDITSGGVETTYSIDNSSPVTAFSPTGSGDVHRQQLWRSDTLTMSDHTLLVNMTKVNPNPQAGEGTVWFDYFVVTDPTKTFSESSTTPDSTTQPATQPSTKNSAHTAVIVGGVLGVLFFLLGVAFLFLFFRRRMKTYTAEDGLAESSLPPDRRGTTIQPFRLMTNTQADDERPPPISSTEFNPWTMVSGSPPMASRKSLITTRAGTSHSNQPSISNLSSVFLASSHEPVPSSSRSADINPVHHRDALTDHDKRRHHPQADGDAASQVNSPAPANENSQRAPLQHVDSGIRATDVRGAEVLAVRVELPPVYSPS